MSFNDQIKTIKRDNYNTPPTNLPLWSNPFLNLSTNEAYNALLTKGGVGADTSTPSLRFNNLPKISNNANQDTVIDDDENLAIHAMSEVYLDPGDRRDMQGFARLPSYGTAETVVYKGAKSIVIGLRGSTMDHLGWDYVTDTEIAAKGAEVPFFTGSMNDRFRDANNTYRALRRRYPNRHIIIGGHSLGNAITLDVLKQNPNDQNLSAYGFNGLAHPDHNEDSRFHHVRKAGDLVSYLGGKFLGGTTIGTNITRKDLLKKTAGLAVAGGLGRAALSVKNIRAVIAATQDQTDAASQFWNSYSNYVRNIRPTSSPADVVVRDRIFADQIPEHILGRPITDITGELVNADVGTGRIIDNTGDVIDWAGPANHSVFTDEPEIVNEMINRYAYKPEAYHVDITNGRAGAIIDGVDDAGERLSARVFHSGQFIDNPAMLDGVTGASVDAMADAAELDAMTLLAPVLGEIAAFSTAFSLGPAALAVMGGYWLWSHSSTRFKPKKNLFIEKTKPDINAPATPDELAAFKARTARFTGDVKPIGKAILRSLFLSTASEFMNTPYDYFGEAGPRPAMPAMGPNQAATVIDNAFYNPTITINNGVLRPSAGGWGALAPGGAAAAAAGGGAAAAGGGAAAAAGGGAAAAGGGAAAAAAAVNPADVAIVEDVLYQTPGAARDEMLSDWAGDFNDAISQYKANPGTFDGSDLEDLGEELDRFKLAEGKTKEEVTAALLVAGVDVKNLKIVMRFIVS